MKVKEVTITSKNQITLPIAMVRNLSLGPNRKLAIREQKGKIILEPQASLLTRMEKHWGKLPPIKGTKTDEELRQAIHKSYGHRQP